MSRFKITVEYDGGGFLGWQRQANGRTVQGEIEAAIERLSGEATTLRAAGRTDAGVHALGQVAHFDLVSSFNADTIRDGLNAHLKTEPIVVLAAELTDPSFDSRLSAVARHYRYRILNRRPPPAVDRHRVWHLPQPLNVALTQAGADMLIGHHDFTTFRSSDCQARSPMKTLDRLEVERQGNEVIVSASARSFLHSQVRSMVGTIARVGTGVWPVERVAAVLEARDRAQCGPLAPPYGLYLVSVDYKRADEK